MGGDSLKTGEVARMLGVDVSTVRNWIAQGKLHAHQTPGGHWRVPAGEVRRLTATGLPAADATQSAMAAVVYVRVREAEQAHLADRALLHLTQSAIRQGFSIQDVIRDVGPAVPAGSGESERPGMEKLRQYIRENKIGVIVVERSDRLLLTGFNEFARWAGEHGVFISQAGLGCAEAGPAYAREIEQDLFFPLADALALAGTNRPWAEQVASGIVADMLRKMGVQP